MENTQKKQTDNRQPSLDTLDSGGLHLHVMRPTEWHLVGPTDLLMGDGGGRDESGDWPGLGADNSGLKTTWAAAVWRPYDLSTSSVYVEWKRPLNAERLIIITTMTILYCLSRAPRSTA